MLSGLDLYQIFPWLENPNSPIFLRRLENTMNIARNVVEHPFVAEALRDKDVVRIVDVCSGIGIVGLVFSKILLERL